MPTPNEPHQLRTPLAGAESADDLEEELQHAFDQIECSEYLELPAAELADWTDVEVALFPDKFEG